MNDVVISAQGLGKRYIIGHQTERGGYTTLRETLGRTVKGFGRAAAEMMKGHQIIAGDEKEDFWALRGIDFEIRRGDVVGIVGRNGAGKSTLLKVLSRITEPTEGRVQIKGRVASLLEVGTGFHPELTGRENIYLNGAILGMSHAEIRRKFDEIVAFAEVERFLDTPVKRYSSGMYVRLAFAVAAHLEPEILIIDEVLAVGDADFQKKCLGKMQDVAGEGRTVLFVSHNMAAVIRLCDSVMLLDKGRSSPIRRDVDVAVRAYLGSQSQARAHWTGIEPAKNEWFQFTSLAADQGQSGQDHAIFDNASPIDVTITGTINALNPALTFGIAVFAETGEQMFWSYISDGAQEKWPQLDVGPFSVTASIPPRLLNSGGYRVEAVASIHHQHWILEPGKGEAAIQFAIEGGLSDSPMWIERRPGMMAPVLDWRRSNEKVFFP